MYLPEDERIPERVVGVAGLAVPLQLGRNGLTQ